jgi:hypothetical protein
MMAVCFNGQWRIGRDSAAFREIARNLVRTHSYVFESSPGRSARRANKQDTVYPGMPVLLAAIERLFGEHDLPPTVVMYLISIGTLIVTYQLIRLAMAPWVAVIVTLCLGFNRIFVEQSNELLSDLPFLFGVMLALLGMEKLHRARGAGQWVIACVLATAGLCCAAVMRPTFWILAVAWILSALSELVWPSSSEGGALRKRAPALVALGLLVGMAVLFIAFDPRTRGGSFLSGGYEERVREQLSNLPHLLSTAWARSAKTLDEHIPVCFFAFAVKANASMVAKVVMACYSIMVVGAGVMLVRVRRMWGIYVLISFGALSILGDVPRYYLMILPLLLAGWCRFSAGVAKWLGPGRRARVLGRWNLTHYVFGALPQWRVMPGLAMLWGIGLVLTPNFVRGLDLVREQRGFDHKLRHRGFAEVYDDGKMAPLVHIAQKLREVAPVKARIIGPEPTILTYLSDRSVFAFEVFTGRHNRGWRTALGNLQFNLAVFPPHEARLLYGDHDPFLCHLFDAHAIVPISRHGLVRTSDGAAIGAFVLRPLPGEHVHGSRRGSRHRTGIRYRQATRPVRAAVPTTR